MPFRVREFVGAERDPPLISSINIEVFGREDGADNAILEPLSCFLTSLVRKVRKEKVVKLEKLVKLKKASKVRKEKLVKLKKLVKLEKKS